MNYCQDGIQVYSAETEEYHLAPIYGHYKIQYIVNDRPYFKSNLGYGIWWSNGVWYIAGQGDHKIGKSLGYASYLSDVFCPNKIQMEEKWDLLYEMGWEDAYKRVRINCKYILEGEICYDFSTSSLSTLRP